jgi:hypothetical protein
MILRLCHDDGTSKRSAFVDESTQQIIINTWYGRVYAVIFKAQYHRQPVAVAVRDFINAPAGRPSFFFGSSSNNKKDIRPIMMFVPNYEYTR